MKSFGRLLRRMRSSTPLEAIAERAGLDPQELATVEAGRITVDEMMARYILMHGFDLNKADTERLILGIQLYDLGLKDNDLRQLVIDMIRKEAPEAVRQELKRLYQSYTAE